MSSSRRTGSYYLFLALVVLGFLITVEAVKRLFYARLAGSVSLRGDFQALTRQVLPHPEASVGDRDAALESGPLETP